MNFRNAVNRFCVAVIAAALVAIAGCSSLPKEATEHGSVTKTTTKTDGSTEKIENASDYASYTRAKLELAAKPLFEMTCPADGCRFASLKVSAPNAGGDLAAPAPPPKVEHASVGIARELKETVLGLQPIAMAATVGSTVSRVFDSFGRSSTAIAGLIQAPQPNVNLSGNNSSLSIGGSSSSTGPVTTTTTTTSTSNTTNTTNSNNVTQTQTCTGGSPTGTTSPGAGGANNCTATRP